MGKADKDQYPNKEVEPSDIPDGEEHLYGPDTEDLVPVDDRGDDIIIEGRSAFALEVSVVDVLDFEEEEGIDINGSAPAAQLQSITFEGYTVWFALGDTWTEALARQENAECGLYDNDGYLYGTDYGYPRNVYCDDNGDNYVPMDEEINPDWTYRWGD